MNNAEIIKQIEEVGTKYGKMMSCMPTNYTNGYMQAVRDCKVPFYGNEEHIPEVKKMIVTNGDRIRNMTDEELADFLARVIATQGNCMWDCEDYNNRGICKVCEECYDGWLKEKVE